MLREFDLTGKKALVTGAGRGIGRGIALALAEAGADVAVASRTISDLESLASEVKTLGRDCFVVPTDVTQRSQVEGLVRRALDSCGCIDILVNNAGRNLIRPIIVPEGEAITPYPGLAEFSGAVSDEEWFTVLNANLTSAFYLCRAVGPHMARKKYGKIINISSVAGLRPQPYYTMYNTAKAALNMLTRALALEWACYQINVNAIAPGPIQTSGTQKRFARPDYLERIISRVPLRRVGQPRDIALMAVYLASPASDFVTGQVFAVDGGRSIA